MPLNLAEFNKISCMNHHTPVRYDLKQGDTVMLKELGGKWMFATVLKIENDAIDVEIQELSDNDFLTITKRNIAAIVLD